MPWLALLLAGCGLSTVGPDIDAWKQAQQADAAVQDADDVQPDGGNPGEDGGDDGAGADTAVDGASGQDADADDPDLDGADPGDADDGSAEDADAETVEPPCSGDEACDDGDACSVDVCTEGVCATSGTIDCDDGDVCTADSCAKASGCVHTAVEDGKIACDDGLACTVDDLCAAGVCKGVDPAGAVALGAPYRGDLRASARSGAQSFAVGAVQQTAASARLAWIVRVADGTGVATATEASTLPANTELTAVAPSDITGIAVHAAGTATVDGKATTLVYARIDASAAVVSSQTSKIGQDAHVAGLVATPLQDGGGQGTLWVGHQLAGSAQAQHPAIWRTDVAGAVNAVPVKLPAGAFHAAARHVRGALAVGSLEVATAQRPVTVLLDAQGAVVRWERVEGKGTGAIEAIASGDGLRFLAGGRWGGDGAQGPTWWLLDPQGRSVRRGVVTGMAGSVVATAAAAAGRFALVVQADAGGAAQLRLVEPSLRTTASALLGDDAAFGAGSKVAALAPALGADAGWLVVGTAPSTGGGDPGLMPIAQIRHAWLQGACAKGDPCGGKSIAACDDGQPCTDDRCLASQGCVHEAHGDACLDGEACLVGASCSAKGCVGGAPRLGLVSTVVDKAAARTPALVAARADGGATVLLRGMSKSQAGSGDLVRYDAAGKALWSTALDGMLAEALVSVDDVAVAVGRLQTGQSLSAFVQGYGPDGKLKWGKAVNTDAQATAFADGCREWAGTILATGVRQPTNANAPVGLLARLDASGTVLMETSIAAASDATGRQLLAVAPRVDGGAWLAGVDPTAKGAENVVLRVDAKGQIEVQRRHGLVSSANDALLPRWQPMPYGLMGLRVELAGGQSQWLVLEPGALFAQLAIALTDLGPDAALQPLLFADGTMGLVGAADGNTTVVRSLPAMGDATTIYSAKIADAVSLSAAATVLVGGDLFVVTQAVTAGDGRKGETARITPSGLSVCATAGICGQTSAVVCESGLPCLPLACSAAGCGQATMAGVCLAPACTLFGTCSAKGCAAGAAIVSCDDFDPCTIDACSVGVGCTYTPAADATPCDDGDACTSPDTCKAGVCMPGAKSGC